MRDKFHCQLQQLNDMLTEMGALCENVIAATAKALINCDTGLARNITAIDDEIDRMERDIETFCLKLLLRQQPVARDLRQISAALKMITDMERIGDQAADIAEIIPFLEGRSNGESEDIKSMALAVIRMVSESVEAYVKQDEELAKEVLALDDVVDNYFDKIKKSLIQMISDNIADGEYAVDLLMTAKYFERIGDHATNIAEWVLFSLTGVHKE